MELVISKDFGVEESSNEELRYDVFPNPTAEDVYIRFYQSKVGSANIVVFNAIGQVVITDDIFVEDKVKEYKLSLDSMPQGVYFLRITNADGLMKTIKIIKE